MKTTFTEAPMITLTAIVAALALGTGILKAWNALSRRQKAIALRGKTA